MKDFRIDGMTQRVFVLSSTDKRIVYIPVKSLHRQDYEELKKLDAETTPSRSLMDILGKHRMKNGRNALAIFQNLIQVADLTDVPGSITSALRVRKPDEPGALKRAQEAAVKAAEEAASHRLSRVITETAEPQQAPQEPVQQEAPVRRKPGPKPGSKNKPKPQPAQTAPDYDSGQDYDFSQSENADLFD